MLNDLEDRPVTTVADKTGFLLAGSVTDEDAAFNESSVDRRTVEACQQGDRDAFRVLFEAHKDRVYSLAVHLCGEDALAKDITQQVFLKLFKVIGQFRHDARFSTWLTRIVINTWHDEQRRRNRFVFLDQITKVTHMVSGISQEETRFRRQIRDAVQGALAELSPKLRVAIVLKYVEGLSYDEIAAVLECSNGTVASRLNRAHKQLARKLDHLRHVFEAKV